MPYVICNVMILLAEELGITTRGVEKQIINLRREGRLRRIGPANGGYWEVIVKG
jgi:ATP-dependent DNA helicase RecG